MTSHSHHPRNSLGTGAVLVVLTLVGWSSVPLFLKYFTDHTDSWTMNGWRYGLSACLWLPFLMWAKWKNGLPPGLWKAAIVPAAINCLGQVCFARAPYYIDPGLLTFMLRFQIVFVAFGAYLLFPTERDVIRDRRFWAGTALAFLGSIGVCLLGSSMPTGATLLGIGLATVAGILFGGYSLGVRYYMSGVNPILAFSAISLYTAAVLLLLMLVLGHDGGADPLSFSRAKFGLLLLSAIVGIALAHVCYYAAIARLGVTIAAGLILLQPFLTGVASFLYFGERLTTAQWTSGAAALVGAVLMIRSQQRVEIARAVPQASATRA
ncbi:MAG: DMT family transporter [Planctomycetota bacterium]|jgi:drug/metabolite transporter (DMT)-like permease